MRFLPLLLAALTAVLSGCGGFGAKHAAGEAAPRQIGFHFTVPPHVAVAYDRWQVTLVQDGQENQVFGSPKDQGVVAKVQPGIYKVVFDLLEGPAVVASNNTPPCTATQQNVDNGASLVIQLCYAPSS